MTETLGHHDPVARLAHAILGFGRWLGRIGFILLTVMVVGVALLATTAIGILLAAAALLLTLGRPRRQRRSEVMDGTLEARPTADGWVIEPHSASR